MDVLKTIAWSKCNNDDANGKETATENPSPSENAAEVLEYGIDVDEVDTPSKSSKRQYFRTSDFPLLDDVFSGLDVPWKSVNRPIIRKMVSTE